MVSGCLEFAASPGVCVACSQCSLDAATGGHKVVYSLKCYSTKYVINASMYALC